MANPGQLWNAPPGDLKLSDNEVHVWRASLEPSLSVIQSLQQILSEDDVIKAHRFYFEKDRHHFIVARGLLRTLLGRYLAVDPGGLRFCYNSYGKPALDLPSDKSRLNFNLSHSHSMVLYAFTLSREVGIDVEYMRPNIEYEQLAASSFSPFENAVFHALPAEIKPQAFFNCWTRKEAYIKARGGGLSIPLDQFDVSLVPGEPAALLSSREDTQETERWLLQELAPGTGYAGALVVEGRGWDPYYWQWEWSG